ncbi:MAG: hypothetical protein HZC48_08390 [Nitrospirae bacterium]|nr:hypothetical protein [Nitrospirota bacterium]
MSNSDDFIKKLKILPDEPLFKDNEEYEEKLDAFGHKAYADTLFDLLEKNPPPLSIGLFGSWGIGKSSIIFTLLKKLNKETIFPVYFNAWKYSGDSFRREFLLSLAQQLGADTETLNRLQRLYHIPLKPDETTNKSFIKQLKEALKDDLKIRKEGIVQVVISFTILGLLSFIYWRLTGDIKIFSVPLIGALITYILQKQMPTLIEFRNTDVVDPKIVFPEQFEHEFGTLLNKERKEKILIIIDDFDRCHANTINDILTSIKTFLKTDKTKNCYFLVSLDDKAVTEILKENNIRYEYEALRKYFDVAVRVSPLGRSDLIDFAKTIAKDTGIPPEVIQIGVLAKCDDARKIKHFINTFITKASILNNRANPDFRIEEHLDSLAKVIVIEELFPDVFQRIIVEPYYLKRLEDFIAHVSNDQEIGSFFSTGESKGLHEFLEATTHVKVEHPELFALLKVSNLQLKLPRGAELTNAILKNKEELIKEILSEISSNEEKRSLIDLIENDMLMKADRLFLTNIITCCLTLAKGDFFNDEQKTVFSKKLLPYLIKLKLHEYDINDIFVSARLAGSNWIKRIADNLREEAKTMAGENPKVSDIINNFYAYNVFMEYPSALYENSFQEVFETWFSKRENEETYLKIIEQIKVPDEEEIKKGQPLILNDKLLSDMINGIDSKTDNAKIALNSLKRNIVFEWWNGRLTKQFSDKINSILAQYSSDAKYTPLINFCFQSILDMPAWLFETMAEPIGNYATSFYDRCSEINGKLDSIKVILVAAASTSNTTVQSDFSDRVSQRLANHTLQYKDIENIDNFILEYQETPYFVKFRERYVKYLFDNLIMQRLNNPDGRIKSLFVFCFEKKDIIGVEKLKKALIQIYQNNTLLQQWKEEIFKYAPPLGEAFVLEICNHMISKIETDANEANLTQFSEVLITLLQHIPEAERSSIISRFMGCVIKDNPTIRKVAVINFDKIRTLGQTIFKTSLNNITRDLCDKNQDEILNFSESLKALLGYRELWTDGEWSDLAGLIKRMLDLKNSENINLFGIELLKEFEAIPNYSADITSELITLTKSAISQSVREESSASLINLKGKLDKKQIDEFLKTK